MDQTTSDPIFEEYLDYKSSESGQIPNQIAKQISRDDFYELIYALHKRFMAGEFSLGRMANMLGITKADLYHLLDKMSLKVTNI